MCNDFSQYDLYWYHISVNGEPIIKNPFKTFRYQNVSHFIYAFKEWFCIHSAYPYVYEYIIFLEKGDDINNYLEPLRKSCTLTFENSKTSLDRCIGYLDERKYYFEEDMVER